MIHVLDKHGFIRKERTIIKGSRVDAIVLTSEVLNGSYTIVKVFIGGIAINIPMTHEEIYAIEDDLLMGKK